MKHANLLSDQIFQANRHLNELQQNLSAKPVLSVNIMFSVLMCIQETKPCKKTHHILLDSNNFLFSQYNNSSGIYTYKSCNVGPFL